MKELIALDDFKVKMPPRPWSYLITARPNEHPGAGHVYIIDATGRKIATIWGPKEMKLATVQLILDAANGVHGPTIGNDGPASQRMT